MGHNVLIRTNGTGNGFRGDRNNKGLEHLADLQDSIGSLKSTMSRMVRISGYRDMNTGVYRFPQHLPGEKARQVDSQLRRMHVDAFSEWLNFPLDEKLTDVKLHLSTLAYDGRTTARTWLKLQSYVQFVPESAGPSERGLFFADLEALLKTIVHDGFDLEYTPPSVGRCEMDESLLATEAVARWLGVSARTVRLWAESDLISAVRVGRQWRFRKIDVQKWLKRSD